MMEEHPIIFFDGVCVICNTTVRWLIRHDSHARLRFAAQQSEKGAALLAKFGMTDVARSSIVLFDQGRIYTHTTAFFTFVAYLDRPWNWLRFGRFIPRVIRDGCYGFVARNRFRWFKPLEQCALPTPAVRQRFVD